MALPGTVTQIMQLFGLGGWQSKSQCALSDQQWLKDFTPQRLDPSAEIPWPRRFLLSEAQALANALLIFKPTEHATSS